jgi:type II secretory pathway component GspD/PulD (secretin)
VEIEAVKVNGQLFANSVTIKELASGSASVRGIVSERANDAVMEFLVGSQHVSVASSPQIIPANKTLADIKNGTDLEVEGTISAGLLTATKVKFR